MSRRLRSRKLAAVQEVGSRSSGECLVARVPLQLIHLFEWACRQEALTTLIVELTSRAYLSDIPVSGTSDRAIRDGSSLEAFVVAKRPAVIFFIT